MILTNDTLKSLPKIQCPSYTALISERMEFPTFCVTIWIRLLFLSILTIQEIRANRFNLLQAERRLTEAKRKYFEQKILYDITQDIVENSSEKQQPSKEVVETRFGFFSPIERVIPAAGTRSLETIVYCRGNYPYDPVAAWQDWKCIWRRSERFYLWLITWGYFASFFQGW